MKKLTIIDGYSFLFRAYYATLKNNNLHTKSGIPINAIHTFTKMINKIINNFEKDECIFVGFDSIKPSFRKEKFKEYKANRPPCPEELKIQMPIAHEFLEAMSIFNYEIDHFEGDDICGSIAKIASKNNYDVTIYTSDHDFFQLIDDNIKIKLIKNGIDNAQEINKENLKLLYGFNANQLIDFKGLTGDKSDNLPGIPGIGPKNAQILLNKFHSFEEIIIQAKNNNQEIKSKLIENLIKYQKQGEISKSLAIIKTDINFPFSIEKLKYQGFLIEKIKNFCEKYELKTLLAVLPKKFIKENDNSNCVKKNNFLINKKEIEKLIEIKEKNKNTILYYIIEQLIKNNDQFYNDFNLKVDIQLSNTEANLIKKVLNLNNFYLISFNYSQIELQILAFLSKTEEITEIFLKKGDVYEKIAQKILKKEISNKEKKNIEKIIKFGIISGNKFKIIEETNLSKEKITELIKKFYIAYPKINLYFKNLISDINKKKYVKNFFNRTCYCNKILIKKIINFPIKETINDIINNSIAKINEEIFKKNFESKLFLQINNFLVFKIKKNEKDELIDKIRNIMENIFLTKLETSVKKII